MSGEQTVTPIATGERTDQPVDVVADEKQPQPETDHLTQSLFGEEVSEAALRGEEETPAPDGGEKPAEKAEEKPGESPQKEEARPTEEKPKEEATMPPPGFVPKAALHEERGKRQALTARLQELEAENESLKKGEAVKPPSQEAPKEEPSKVPADFKVLTHEEFKELAETDVVEAQIYKYNLDLYKEEQKAKETQAEGARQLQEQTSQIIERRYTEMEEAVPGIFADDGEVNKALMDFASSHGVEPEILSTLTDPGTRIVQPDGRVVILGKGAVQVLKLVNDFYHGTKPDPTKEQAIKEKATAEVIKKIQDTSGGYRSIGETPDGGASVPLDMSKALTEAELAKLSPEEQQRYLSGA